jgi:hypothetical protein
MTSRNPIQKQADELKQTLLDPDTSGIFLQAALTLWKLFIQFVRLIILVVVLVFGAAILLWSVCFQGGRATREWLAKNEQATNDQFLAYLIERLMVPVQAVVAWADRETKAILGTTGASLWGTGDRPSLKASDAASTDAITVSKKEMAD